MHKEHGGHSVAEGDGEDCRRLQHDFSVYFGGKLLRPPSERSEESRFTRFRFDLADLGLEDLLPADFAHDQAHAAAVEDVAAVEMPLRMADDPIADGSQPAFGELSRADRRRGRCPVSSLSRARLSPPPTTHAQPDGMAWTGSRSYSSWISPTSSSSTSSSVIRPTILPAASRTRAMCVCSRMRRSRQAASNMSSRRLGSGRRIDRSDGSCGLAQLHQRHQILEIDVAQDRLGIAVPLGDGKPRVHFQVRRNQATIQRRVHVEHADVLGRQHDFAHAAAGEPRGAENNPLLALADQPRRPGGSGMGAELEQLDRLRLRRPDPCAAASGVRSRPSSP